jgi:hypothetical protein
MSQLVPSEILGLVAKFEERGTRVRPPADEQSLLRLEHAIKGSLSEEARILFSVFDGFDEQMADEATMVCLWSADAISKTAELEGDAPRGQVIGDYFLSADLFRCDLRSNASMVWWEDRGDIAAKSLTEFYQRIADGLFKP